MADSLRDQLIAAGFEAPKKTVKKTPPKGHGKGKSGSAKKAPGKKGRPNTNRKNTEGKKPATQTQNKNSADDAAIAERKKLKAQIKELIDSNKLENWKGEIAYRYIVEKRIRELYVNEAALKQLTGRAVAITRLNGDTYLIPTETATEVRTINPQWSVFNSAEESENNNKDDDEYSEFQVPDDLQW